MEIYNSFDEKRINFIHTLVSDINTLKQELAKFKPVTQTSSSGIPITKYCCPIKLVSSHRCVLGYRSGGSRVTFVIYKPLYPNNNSCSVGLWLVLASKSSQSFSGKLNRL